MPEEKRQTLKEYQKNIEKQKSLSIITNKIVYVLFLANYSSDQIRFDLIVRVTVWFTFF